MMPGELVTLYLSEKHEIARPGNGIKHKATFLHYHADREWCDVELAKEHAGSALAAKSQERVLSVPVSCITADLDV